MKATPNRLSRSIASALLCGALTLSLGSAIAQPYGEGGRGPGPRAPMTEAERSAMRERMQERMQQRLDRLAARLDIKTSQQSAWDEFRRTVTSMFKDRPQRPSADADAATLMRFRAEMAQRRAQQLATVAEATAKLQTALEPEQRKILDEIARTMGPGARRGSGHEFHRGPREGFNLRG
jgi:hypothetical protein